MVNNKQLSKNESKYRKKFIQEHHYNKEEQRIFDGLIRDSHCSYQYIYKAVKRGEHFAFMASLSILKLSRLLYKTSTSACKYADAFSNFSKHCRKECDINEDGINRT